MMIDVMMTYMEDSYMILLASWPLTDMMTSKPTTLGHTQFLGCQRFQQLEQAWLLCPALIACC